MRDTFLDELTLLAEADPDVILITGDLGFGVFDKFAANFPKQFLNVGVAEQNMTMVATGLAMEGKKVFTYSIGNFPTLRCLEQIRNDVCYHDLNVTVICIGGGFSYGQLGMSHHATEDLSIMRALPNMFVVAPSSTLEVKGAMQSLYKRTGPSYLRLDKSKSDLNDNTISYKLGEACMVRDGSAVTLICCGGILQDVYQATSELKLEGIECRVLSMHTIKPIDKAAIQRASNETGGIITVEENTIVGGLGGAIAECCLESSKRPRFFKRIGLKDLYSSVVGEQSYLRNYYHMGVFHIKETVKTYC